MLPQDFKKLTRKTLGTVESGQKLKHEENLGNSKEHHEVPTLTTKLAKPRRSHVRTVPLQWSDHFTAWRGLRE